MNTEKLLRIFVISIVITVVITAVKALPEKSILASNFGGEFTLTNHLGEQVTNKNFKNQYRLVYFGFTYCPAICPTELQRITTILKELGSASKQIQPIFITVDPARDTVEAMKSYVGLFHPKLIGLTGTQAQIDVVKKAYHVYSAKVLEEGMTDYTVDHSSYIYFMGQNDELIQIFKADDTIDDMVERVKKRLVL